MKQITKHMDKLHPRELQRHAQEQGYGFWIFVFVMIVIASMIVFFDIEALTADFIKSYGYKGVFLFSFFADFLVQPIGPDVVLILGITSAQLVPWIVLLLVLLGSYCTMTATYFIGKRFGDPALYNLLGKRNYAKMQQNLKYGKLYLVLSAISPIPYVPYLAGIWKLSFWEVCLYMAIPRTLRFVAVFLFVVNVF